MTVRLVPFTDEHVAPMEATIVDDDRFAGYAVTGPIDRVGQEVELGYAVSP